MNWLELVDTMRTLAKRLHEVSMPMAEPYLEPNAGATEEEILAAESTLGHPLHPLHREFLRHANGWSYFSGGAVSLLGTSDFLGSSLKERAKLNLGYISGAALGPYRWKRKKLFPIGASDATLDVICMQTNGKSVLPGVIWFNNTEPDEYADFEAYFRAIISYKPQSIEAAINRSRTR